MHSCCLPFLCFLGRVGIARSIFFNIILISEGILKGMYTVLNVFEHSVPSFPGAAFYTDEFQHLTSFGMFFPERQVFTDPTRDPSGAPGKLDACAGSGVRRSLLSLLGS